MGKTKEKEQQRDVGFSIRKAKRETGMNMAGETLQIVLKSLKSHYLFRRMSTPQLTNMAMSMRPSKLKIGDYVMRQGETSDGFFILEKGCVDVIVDTRKVKTLFRGSSFGELALLYNMPRSASIRVSEIKSLGGDGDQVMIPSLARVVGGTQRNQQKQSNDKAERKIVQRSHSFTLGDANKNVIKKKKKQVFSKDSFVVKNNDSNSCYLWVLERRQFLKHVKQEYCFTNMDVQESIYGQLLENQRKRIHGIVATMSDETICSVRIVSMILSLSFSLSHTYTHQQDTLCHHSMVSNLPGEEKIRIAERAAVKAMKRGDFVYSQQWYTLLLTYALYGTNVKRGDVKDVLPGFVVSNIPKDFINIVRSIPNELKDVKKYLRIRNRSVAHQHKNKLKQRSVSITTTSLKPRSSETFSIQSEKNLFHSIMLPQSLLDARALSIQTMKDTVQNHRKSRLEVDEAEAEGVSSKTNDVSDRSRRKSSQRESLLMFVKWLIALGNTYMKMNRHITAFNVGRLALKYMNLPLWNVPLRVLQNDVKTASCFFGVCSSRSSRLRNTIQTLNRELMSSSTAKIAIASDTYHLVEISLRKFLDGVVTMTGT